MASAAAARRTLHRLAQLHEDDALVAWWQARSSWLFAPLTPERRRFVLSLAAIGAGVGYVLRTVRRHPEVAGPFSWPLAWATLLVLLGLVYGCYLAASRFSRLPDAVRRRPQLSLHALFWGALAVVWVTPAEAGWWRRVLVTAVVATPYLLWRCGYLLLSGQRGRVTGTRFFDHLFYLFPAYGGTHTPYGKGFDFLTRYEARTPEALARAQLAGMKLLLLSVLWRIGLQVTDALPVPPLGRLVGRPAGVSLLTAWASLYVELVREVLEHAAKGHVIIGVLRLLGFHVFRNTYKPLLAESVVEFWNRYYYYFKELLVDFFFLPTYVRHLRRWPRLRMLAATFAAAFAGNMYHHLLAQETLLVLGNVRGLWLVLYSRLFYCLLLATGIYVSMLREQRRRGAGVRASFIPVRRLLAIAGVWTFFGIIHIWNVGAMATFGQRTRFFLSLLGVA